MLHNTRKTPGPSEVVDLITEGGLLKIWVWLVTASREENSTRENIMKKEIAWRTVREEEHGRETKVKGDVSGDGEKVNQ